MKVGEPGYVRPDERDDYTLVAVKVFPETRMKLRRVKADLGLRTMDDTIHFLLEQAGLYV